MEAVGLEAGVDGSVDDNGSDSVWACGCACLNPAAVRCGRGRRKRQARARRRFLPADAPAVALPPVRAARHKRAIAKPRARAAVGIVTIEGYADEESTAKKDASREAANEDGSVKMADGDAMKVTDKGAVGGEAEAAKTKTTEVSKPAAEVSKPAAEVSEPAAEVSKPAAAEVSEPAAAEVSEPATTETAHRRYPRGVRNIDRRKNSRACLDCRERQSGARKRRSHKLMLEH